MKEYEWILLPTHGPFQDWQQDFPIGLVVKNPPIDAGVTVSIPGGKIPQASRPMYHNY